MRKQECNILRESYTEAVLKRNVSYKKARISMDDPPLAVIMKAYLIHFFCSAMNLKMLLRES